MSNNVKIPAPFELNPELLKNGPGGEVKEVLETEKEQEVIVGDVSKMNIYQRLSKVRQAVSFIRKEQLNEKMKYKGVSSSMVLYPLHEAINNFGLILVPELISKTDRVKTAINQYNKEYSTFIVELNMKFTWVNIDNPSEKIECSWSGYGVNEDISKAIGAGYTYAEKYFMLKFFNISTDEDDPDTKVSDPIIPDKKPIEPQKKVVEPIKKSTAKEQQEDLKVKAWNELKAIQDVTLLKPFLETYKQLIGDARFDQAVKNKKEMIERADQAIAEIGK